MRNRIVAIDPKDGSTTAWPVLDERAYLTSLAVDAENVYAADAGNRVVLRSDHAGKLLGRIGERDDARQIPGLVVPSPYLDVAFDPQGALWVVNPGKHGLESYRLNGELISAWYRPSMELDGFCGCCNPMHVAFRRDGSLVTAEKGLDRVKVYAPDNTLLGVVATPEAFGDSTNQAQPCTTEAVIGDIVTDAAGRVYVLDKTRDTVRIFEEEAGTP
jgi:DNA-binding beta-propeller fold protein YncE